MTMNTEQLFGQLVQNTYSNINSDEDLQKDDRRRMKERNKKYSEILDIYALNVKLVLRIKIIFRVIFLIVSIGALVGTFVLFCFVLRWVTYSEIKIGYLEYIVSIIASRVSMITVFMVLPKIMTKYLFDIEEEKNIYNIAKQIQDYDHIIRDNLK